MIMIHKWLGKQEIWIWSERGRQWSCLAMNVEMWEESLAAAAAALSTNCKGDRPGRPTTTELPSSIQEQTKDNLG